MPFPTQNAGRTRRSAVLALAGLLVAAALLASLRLRPAAQARALRPAAARTPAHLDPLKLISGQTWRLEDHRGQLVLLNYWATWCEPCREELPDLLRIAHTADPQAVTMLGISLDTGTNAPTAVARFAGRYRLPYPVALAPPAPVFGASPVQALPTTLLLDRQGRVAATWVGPIVPAEVERDIALLLAEPAPPSPDLPQPQPQPQPTETATASSP